MLDGVAVVVFGVMILLAWLAVWIVIAQVVSAVMWVFGHRPKMHVPWYERVVFGNLTRMA